MEITTLLVATLPWLFILACPLVMWWMMRSMGCDNRPSADPAGEPPRAGAEEEIRLLNVVVRLLEERPQVAGVAVPGMPAGVPGMPGAGFGSYDVLAFEADGATRVYASR